MKRSRTDVWVLALMTLMPLIAVNGWAVDSQTAVRAANLWTRIQYPGDAHESYEPARYVQIADLDQNGKDEVIYLHRIPCDGGGSFDCTNSVTVLKTPISRDAEVLRSKGPFVSMFDDPKQSVIDLGYEYDASLHVPGEIKKLVIVGHTIRVTFMATLESHACLRGLRKRHPEWSQSDCPPPGRYVWTLQWKPGELKRLQ